MNKPIRFLAVAFGFLFLALLLGVNHLQVVRADDLNSKPGNRRVLDDEFSRERGAILVAGEPIAESVPSGDQWLFQRTYPHGELYADVTGFFSYTYGRSGIEQTYNQVLSGSDNRFFVNRIVDLLSNKQPQGGSVELTLNPAAQRAAAAGLAELGKDTRGAVVAIDPSDGAILAMVSQPTYDPNDLASHKLKSVTKKWNKLNKDKTQPLLNRSTNTTLPPGSTFKVVTAAAALAELGLDTDSNVRGGASLSFPGMSYKLVNQGGSSCGGSKISFEHALNVSCNVSFGWLAGKVGQTALEEQAEAFGFGARPLKDLSSSPSVFAESGIELEAPQLAQSAIGQFEVRASPLQMAMVTAGIANEGVVMEPQLVRTVRAPNLQVLNQIEPNELGRAMEPADARKLRRMMVSVVDRGTGTPARIPGVKVGGKTGTAESSPDRPPYAWFIGFAPENNPRVAVAVLVESTKNTNDIAGGRLGGPIARAVIEAVLR